MQRSHHTQSRPRVRGGWPKLWKVRQGCTAVLRHARHAERDLWPLEAGIFYRVQVFRMGINIWWSVIKGKWGQNRWWNQFSWHTLESRWMSIWCSSEDAEVVQRWRCLGWILLVDLPAQEGTQIVQIGGLGASPTALTSSTSAEKPSLLRVWLQKVTGGATAMNLSLFKVIPSSRHLVSIWWILSKCVGKFSSNGRISSTAFPASRVAAQRSDFFRY